MFVFGDEIGERFLFELQFFELGVEAFEDFVGAVGTQRMGHLRVSRCDLEDVFEHREVVEVVFEVGVEEVLEVEVEVGEWVWAMSAS